jgi:hypothetical protein
MRSVLEYVRQHAIATLALGCSLLALAGSSYAAFSLPRGSVGGPQIKNHVIDPVKFDPKTINGSVRAWAYYSPEQRYTTGPGRPEVRSGTPGLYLVGWRKIVLPTTACAVLATVDQAAGYAVATRVRHEIGVSTYSAQGQLSALAFQVVVIC